MHHLVTALAQYLYHRDQSLRRAGGEIVIVDEFTGRPDGGAALERRPAPGGRGQGNVAIQPENQTLASITFQNYFRLYGKLSA